MSVLLCVRPRAVRVAGSVWDAPQAGPLPTPEAGGDETLSQRELPSVVLVATAFLHRRLWCRVRNVPYLPGFLPQRGVLSVV